MGAIWGDPSGPQLELWPRPGRSSNLTLRLLDAEGHETELNPETLARSIAQAGAPGDGLDWDTAISLARAAVAYLRRSSEPEPFAFSVVKRTVERTLQGMGYARSAQLFARTEGHGLATSADALRDHHPWNAVCRVGEATHHLSFWLERSGLPEDAAAEITSVVTAQIVESGIESGTPGLFREWAIAELIRRGKSEEAERIAHIAVPMAEVAAFYAEDAMSGPDEANATHNLGSRMSRAFALARIYPDAAARAHLRGEIAISGLADLGRLESVTLDIEGLKQHGPFDIEQDHAGPPATDAARLSRYVSRHSRAISARFTKSVRWPAINFGLGPFIEEMDEDEMARVAHGLLFETARAERPVSAPTIELELAWDLPESLPGSLRRPNGELTARDSALAPGRRFFTRMVEALAAISERGAPVDFPAITLVLSPYFFGAPEATRLLLLVDQIVRNGFPLVLRYDSTDTYPFDGATQFPQATIVAQTVTVPLDVLARRAGGTNAFFARLEQAVDDAVAAHLGRHDHIAQIARYRSGAFAKLLRRYGDSTLLDVGALNYEIAASGVQEFLQGTEWLSREAAPAALDTTLARMRRLCDKWAAATDRRIRLSGGDEATDRIGDVRDAFAAQVASHAHYSVPACCRIELAALDRQTDSLPEFVRWAFLYTPCRAIRLA